MINCVLHSINRKSCKHFHSDRCELNRISANINAIGATKCSGFEWKATDCGKYAEQIKSYEDRLWAARRQVEDLEDDLDRLVKQLGGDRVPEK